MKNLLFVITSLTLSMSVSAMKDFETNNDVDYTAIKQQSKVIEVVDLPSAQINYLGIQSDPIYLVAIEPVGQTLLFNIPKPIPEGYTVSPQPGHLNSDLIGVLKTTSRQTSFLSYKMTEPKWMFKNRATEYRCG